MIIFASQTGNANSIAHILKSKTNDELFCMNEIKPSQLNGTVFIITSTTGDGEIPDNGRKFYRLLKKEKPDLTDINYCILALGDSNYSKYCNSGILFNNLFKKLQANPLFDMVMADEATGLESYVEPWLNKTENYFKNTVLPFKLNNEGSLKKTYYHAMVVDSFKTTSRTIVLNLNIKEDIIWFPGQSIAIYMTDNSSPRYYSIASSPLQKDKYKKIKIIFTIYGECTKWLSTLKKDNIVKFNLSETNAFDININDIFSDFVAIGSGISPIIGIMWHMYYLKEQNKDDEIEWRGSVFKNKTSIDYKPILRLFYGCRTEEDIICYDELNFFVKNNILKEIIFAFSRSTEKVYITDKLKNYSLNPHVLVCGKERLISLLKMKYPEIKFTYEFWN